ncbi:MAG: ATP-binding protein [Cryomorphaceae bacterium]
MTHSFKVAKSRNIALSSRLVFGISSVAIGLHLFDAHQVWHMVPGVPPMELTTALSFFLISLAVLTSQKGNYVATLANKVSIIGVLIGAAWSIYLSFTRSDFTADASVVNGFYAVLFEERMTLATAISFFLLGISVWGMESKSEKTKHIFEYVFSVIIALNFVSILLFVLNIPANDTGFLIPIPIHTSFILFWYAGFLSHKNADKAFNDLIYGKYSGSKLIRTAGPYNFTASMLMGLTLLYLVNEYGVSFNVGFIIYTVIAVFVSVVHVFVLALRLNTAEHEKNAIANALSVSTKEMNQYKEALDASSLVDITSADGTIISVNDKFCEVSEYERHELIGKKHSIFNSGHHPKSFFDALWTKVKKGEVWVGGIKNKTKNGEFFWVQTAIIPFKNEQGEIYQFLTIRQDITKHSQLTMQYENLELKNKELEQFTYIASHDLQEPLKSVRSLLDILQAEYTGKLDKDADMLINYMTEATDRMSNLIKGLLDFSRIGLEKELGTIDSTETIYDITKDLQALIEQKGAILTLDKLPVIKAYKTEIRLLFQNLISNAIIFQKDGVRPEIHIGIQEDRDFWKFSIKDNGIGIPQKEIRNVFAIFKRLNDRKSYEGTGIGLAHCEKVVHLHGGTIWVTSEKGQGSTFYFTILKDLY